MDYRLRGRIAFLLSIFEGLLKCLELRFGELDRNRLVAGLGAVVLMMQWPQGRSNDVNWKIQLLHILQ